MVDTPTNDWYLMQELEEEKAARIGAQKSEAQALLQYQLAKAECERTKEELRLCKQQLILSSLSSLSPLSLFPSHSFSHYL